LSFHNTMFLHYTLFRFIIPPPPRSTLFPYTTLFRSYKFMQISTPEAEPLISNTTVVFGLLMTILGLVFYSSSLSNKYVKGFYNIIPPLLLCYFLPGLLNSFGVIDGENSPLTSIGSRYFL